MQKCNKKIKLLISRELDGDLSTKERIFLKNYLEKHKECEKYKEELLFLKNAISLSLSDTEKGSIIFKKPSKKKHHLNFITKIVAIFVIIFAIGILTTTITINTKNYFAKKSTSQYYYEPIDVFSEYIYKSEYSEINSDDNFYEPIAEYVIAINY